MLTDSHDFRQQPNGGDHSHFSEHSSDNGSTASKNAHQVSEAIDRAFYELWVALPSWSPIRLTDGSWLTDKSKSGKKVPLTFQAVERAYRLDKTIGKRFGRLTNYLMIDVDINSPFHPRHQGIGAILKAMESIGLCRYILVRSSSSGGLHIYFPLPEPVNSWALACTAHTALTVTGVAVASGTCELFPNRKSYGGGHNGHRLPLQQGSCLLNEDYQPFSHSKVAFVQIWTAAAALQDMPHLTAALSLQVTVPALPTSRPSASAHPLPPFDWTAFGQSNEIMRKLVNYGDRFLGLKTVDALAEWIQAVAPQMPGYQQFASPKSKADIEQGDWAYRWAKCHFEKAWAYAMSGPDHNAKVAADAKARIFAALKQVTVSSSLGITDLWKLVSKKSLQLFAKGVAFDTFKKYKDLVQAFIASSCNLGPSSGQVEDIILSFPEPDPPVIAEVSSGELKGRAQLLTVRCVTALYSSILDSFNTPEFPVAAPADEPPKEVSKPPAELTTGQPVLIKLLGCPMNGVKTRVRGKTKDELGRRVYRLDYRLHGQYMVLPVECLTVVDTTDGPQSLSTVIRATAAQLRQVLGRASPFVGPGFWEVRRGDIPAQAWVLLRQLTGSG